MEEKEIWKDIAGYEGKYQVSNFGRIKSLPINTGLKVGQRHFDKMLTPVKDTTGYYRVHLRRDGRDKRIAVHRLVAMAFVENPKMYKYVNHKDENKTNNNASNLEWCTAKYNTNYGTSVQRRRNTFVGNHGRPVDMFDMDGNFIKHYDCTRSVMEDGFNPSGVYMCCCGKQGCTQSGGYVWRFSNKAY
jgi:hypothetical protein